MKCGYGMAVDGIKLRVKLLRPEFVPGWYTIHIEIKWFYLVVPILIYMGPHMAIPGNGTESIGLR